MKMRWNWSLDAEWRGSKLSATRLIALLLARHVEQGQKRTRLDLTVVSDPREIDLFVAHQQFLRGHPATPTWILSTFNYIKNQPHTV